MSKYKVFNRDQTLFIGLIYLNIICLVFSNCKYDKKEELPLKTDFTINDKTLRDASDLVGKIDPTDVSYVFNAKVGMVCKIKDISQPVDGISDWSWYLIDPSETELSIAQSAEFEFTPTSPGLFRLRLCHNQRKSCTDRWIKIDGPNYGGNESMKKKFIEIENNRKYEEKKYAMELEEQDRLVKEKKEEKILLEQQKLQNLNKQKEAEKQRIALEKQRIAAEKDAIRAQDQMQKALAEERARKIRIEEEEARKKLVIKQREDADLAEKARQANEALLKLEMERKAKEKEAETARLAAIEKEKKLEDERIKNEALAKQLESEKKRQQEIDNAKAKETAQTLQPKSGETTVNEGSYNTKLSKESIILLPESEDCIRTNSDKIKEGSMKIISNTTVRLKGANVYSSSAGKIKLTLTGPNGQSGELVKNLNAGLCSIRFSEWPHLLLRSGEQWILSFSSIDALSLYQANNCINTAPKELKALNQLFLFNLSYYN